MKNLFKLICIIILTYSSFGFAQNYVNSDAKELLESTRDATSKKRRLLYCATISCCSIGEFGVEIWSDKECHYIVTGKRITVVNLKNNDGSDFKGSEIEVREDITLIDKDSSLETDGQESVMKAGLYKVIDGEVAFEPTVQRIRIKKICYEETHEGTIFGHHYSYSTSICLYYPSFSHQVKNIQGGYAVINLTDDAIKLAEKNNNALVFDKDIILGNEYIIRAGKYNVDDGKIYTRNVQLK